MMLVPRSHLETTSAYRFDQSDSDGTFTWRGHLARCIPDVRIRICEPDDFAIRDRAQTAAPSAIVHGNECGGSEYRFHTSRTA